MGALLAVALGCSACGGGGTGGTTVASPYAGTYYGEYVDKSGNAGPFQVTVGTSGSVTGLFSTSHLVQGSVGATGAGTVNYGGTQAKIQFGPYGEPTTQLDIEPVSSGVPSALAVLVAGSAVASGANPFAGNFAGSIQDQTTNKPGALACTIDGSGTVVGLGAILVNGTPTLTSIEGTLTSSGSLNYVEGINQVTVSGNLTKGNAVYGPVQISNGDTGTITLTPYSNSYPPPAQHISSR